ncbi:MAG: tetratricopeptide repeat protein, partial [Bryobacteraceae bacterium]
TLALFAAFEVYGPALNGPFLFDDRYLPFLSPDAPARPFLHWIGGGRSLLMLSFWANFRVGGTEAFGYHAVNVLLHFFNAIFVWLIVRKLLEGVEAARATILAVFAGLLFLLHPVQTESVAYVASRSEALSVFFAYAALTVFLYRTRVEATFQVAAAVLLLFGAAVLTKEHTAVLPGVLLLADYFFNPREGAFSFDGIRKNWRLYAPLSVGAIAGFAWVIRTTAGADTAGFGMKDLPWTDYLWTQGRVLWVYLRLFLLPVGLNADYDLPFSRSPLEHGAIFGLAAFAGLLVAALVLRRKYPLAAFGFFTFALLIAPTSSIVPIRDPIAERRLYLPFLGLALVAVDLLRRIKIGAAPLAAALAAALAICAVGTYQRAQVWGDPLVFWTDAAAKSPNKARPQFQLAYAHYEMGRCDVASDAYARTAKLQPMSYELALDWAIALDCAGHPQEAIQKLDQAELLERSAHPLAEKARILFKLARNEEAFAALDRAEKIDPAFELTYLYRGGFYENLSSFAAAAAQYRKVLSLNPINATARSGLTRVEFALGRPR